MTGRGAVRGRLTAAGRSSAGRSQGGMYVHLGRHTSGDIPWYVPGGQREHEEGSAARNQGLALASASVVGRDCSRFESPVHALEPRAGLLFDNILLLGILGP